MNSNDLVEAGNQHRANNDPEQALQCYARAFVQDPDCAAAFNNYGNVMRECGYPDRAIPFLQHAIVLNPNNVTAKFNLAVSWLLMGNYQQSHSLHNHAGAVKISMARLFLL